MRALLKLALAAACFIAGSGLLSTYGVMAAASVASPANGMALTNLMGLAVGAALIGAGIDALPFKRRRKPANEGIAHSVWATPEHLAHYDITEPRP